MPKQPTPHEADDVTGGLTFPRPRDAQHVSALRYFYEVARGGSIRAASEGLNIAPSAISRQIGKLEEEVGEALFERRARGMVLTPAGQVYQVYVLDALMSLRRLHSEISELRGLKRGQVRVATIEGLVTSFLSRAVSDFRKELPGITFEVTITSADDVITRIQSGAADIGLAFNAPATSAIDYTRRIPDPVAAIMAPSYSLADKSHLSLRDVLQHPIAIPVQTFGIRNLLDHACREARLALSPALETNSIEALRSFARHGDGIAFLHSYAVENDLRSGALIAVDLRVPSLRIGTIDLCVLSERRLPVAAREFLDFLERRLPQT